MSFTRSKRFKNCGINPNLRCKGGGDTTTVQSADPWSGQQQYLTDSFQQAQNLNQNYTPEYYPNPTVAGQSGATTGYLDSLAAFGGSPGAQNILDQSAAGTNQLFDLAGEGNYLGQIGQALGYNGANYANSIMATNPSVDLTAAAQGGADLFQGEGTNNSQTVFNQLSQQGGNPYVDQVVADMARATTDNFNRSVLPQISTQALADNSYGGSRQGIAEGLATQGLNTAIADTSGRLYADAYNTDIAQQLQAGGQADQTSQAQLNQRLQQLGFGAGLTTQEQGIQQANQTLGFNAANLGLSTLGQGQNFAVDATTKGLTLLPQQQQLALQNLSTLGQAGQGYDAYSQALLSDDVNAFNFYQNAPQESLARYVAAIQGSYGGTTTSTGPEQSSGGIPGALGGAGVGAGIAGALSLGPAAPWVVGGSALAGYLS